MKVKLGLAAYLMLLGSQICARPTSIFVNTRGEAEAGRAVLELDTEWTNNELYRATAAELGVPIDGLTLLNDGLPIPNDAQKIDRGLDLGARVDAVSRDFDLLPAHFPISVRDLHQWGKFTQMNVNSGMTNNELYRAVSSKLGVPISRLLYAGYTIPNDTQEILRAIDGHIDAIRSAAPASGSGGSGDPLE